MIGTNKVIKYYNILSFEVFQLFWTKQHDVLVKYLQWKIRFICELTDEFTVINRNLYIISDNFT